MAIAIAEVNQEIQRIESLPISPEDKAIMKESLFRRLDAQQAEDTQSAKEITYYAGKQVAYEVPVDADSYRWFKPQLDRFIPSFIGAKECSQEYTLRYGEITGLRVRRLVAGDFTFLASLAPRCITKLKDNVSIFDPVSGEPKLMQMLHSVVSTALSDWDYEAHAPTGFALEVLNAIVTLDRYKDGMQGAVVVHEPAFTVDDLLNSDPQEVLDYVMAMYRANVNFFSRITTSNGIIHGLTTTVAGIYTNIKNSLKEMAQSLTLMEQQTATETQPIEDSSGSGGQKNGGKTNSSRSSSKQKGT